MIIERNIDQKIKIGTLSELLFDVPQIITVNEFNDKAVEKFKIEFMKACWSKQEIIPIVIDSFGGQVYSLLAMIDIVKSANKPIATIAQGKAMSCGAVLFTCGSEGMRYMSPLCTLMIHDVSSGCHGKVEEVKADAKESERLNQMIYNIMATNCNKPLSYFLDIVHERGHADWFITGEEAKSHNLANHLYVPKLKVNVEVKMSLE